MKILTFHKTTDSDIKQGLQVCYKNIDGVFNNLGVITDIITDKDGIKNYLINTAMGAYMADELKLIALNTYKISFTGRLKGAIGIFYPITDKVQATDEKAAILALYDKYEHISNPKVKKIK